MSTLLQYTPDRDMLKSSSIMTVLFKNLDKMKTKNNCDSFQRFD